MADTLDRNLDSRRVRLLFSSVVVCLIVVLASVQVSAASRQVGLDINGQFDDDLLGWSLATNAAGTRIVAGAPGLQRGTVRVFDLKDGSWEQLGSSLRGSGSIDRLGGSVDITPNGSRIVAGGNLSRARNGLYATGTVEVFDLVGDRKVRVGQPIYGRSGGDQFGYAVAISANGTRVVVGAPQIAAGTPPTGEVRIFDLVGSQWVQVGTDINGPSAQSWFGRTVAISSNGSRVIVGAPAHDIDSFGEGSAQVFEVANGNWRTLGDPIEGTEFLEKVGGAVAISNNGSRIALSSAGSGDGQVEVYDFDGTSWARVGNSVQGLTDGFISQISVSLSANGSRVAVGLPGDDSVGDLSGKVAIFELSGSTWTEVDTIFGRARLDSIGYDIELSADGSRVAIGGDGDGIVARSAGQVRVFDLDQRAVFCSGREATIVGTAGDDVLTGSAHADVIAGLQGNDTIRGLGGDDIICGGRGNDVIYGGDGFDILFGAQGRDQLFAATGATAAAREDIRGARMFGGAGNDTVHGSTRWDRMQGGPGNDRLFGYEGRDWMRAGAGADVVNGGSNIDDMHGGNGNDQIIVNGNDAVRGGAGKRDRCEIASGSNPAPLIGCELRG